MYPRYGYDQSPLPPLRTMLSALPIALALLLMVGSTIGILVYALLTASSSCESKPQMTYLPSTSSMLLDMREWTVERVSEPNGALSPSFVELKSRNR